MALESQQNFREAHRLLTLALWKGFRNPIQHELEIELVTNDVITYQDCLDALSVLSHLQRRLDAAVDAHFATSGESTTE